MGMAAGQARLLSITSRMSDNELRAQIINNDKMRLATKSSQVSEAYVTALNDAQMMFTNYDADNNASYKQLTFNALTSYNQYNNQYGISDMSGRLLVSENDAINFQNANGDINKFLESYGLENKTTYFDNLNEYANADGTIPYSTGTVDSKGNVILAETGLTAKQLQEAYEGVDGNPIHPGYNATVASTGYYNYNSAITKFSSAYDAWSETIASNMSNYLNTMNADGITLSNIQASAEGATSISAITTTLNNLSKFVSEATKYSLGTTDSKVFFKTLQEQIEATKNDTIIYNNSNSTLTYSKGAAAGENSTIEFFGKNTDASGNVVNEPLFKIEKTIASVDADGNPESYNSGYTIYIYNGEKEDGGGYETVTGANVTKSGNNLTLSYGTAPDNVTYSQIPDYFEDPSASSTYNITQKHPLELDTMKDTTIALINSLKNSIYRVWNPSLEIFANTDSNEYKAYEAAAKDLEQAIFGTSGNVTKEEYPNLVNVSWILSQMNDAQKNNFQPILDVILLDNIMNTYGEPKYAWVDSTKPTDSYNENGDAKAQWYTNLFNRMLSGGYKALQDGLASSSEWMKFAFESGLVTMEQVDSTYTWNTVMYSNCSDITEQTNTAAITIAEAEYNAAMNKIENKDKRYDMELKNIDTEHNSLQTEYDSIKSAIDKNIERTFKIYS